MSKANHFLDHFFFPKSVAIVGATNSTLRLNYYLVQNLINLGFQGKIHPVNPKATEIQGIRSYARLKNIADRVDLVVSAVPAPRTMDIVKECNEIGVKHLVIVAGGFAEGGKQGQELHQALATFVQEKGMRILGPNTLSPINTLNNLAVSFNPIKKLRHGGLSFAFQSGFYELSIDWLLSRLGINKIIDMGNKMDINEVDALEYFAQDPTTRVIAMHIESIRGSGRNFFRLLKEVSGKKPTIILKSGRTLAGSRAAASHTGSIAGENDVVFDSILKQTSAIRAQNLEDFFDLAKAFGSLGFPQGERLAIIALSGGEGVMATDACEMNGLKLARLGKSTYDKLKKILPPWEIPLNPFDAGVCFQFSDPQTLFDTLAAIPEDENVDCAVMQMAPNLIELALRDQNLCHEAIESVRDQYLHVYLKMKSSGKPFALYCFSMGVREKELAEALDCNSLPVFQSSERAIRALAAMHQYRLRRSR